MDLGRSPLFRIDRYRLASRHTPAELVARAHDAAMDDHRWRVAEPGRSSPPPPGPTRIVLRPRRIRGQGEPLLVAECRPVATRTDLLVEIRLSRPATVTFAFWSVAAAMVGIASILSTTSSGNPMMLVGLIIPLGGVAVVLTTARHAERDRETLRGVFAEICSEPVSRWGAGTRGRAIDKDGEP